MLGTQFELPDDVKAGQDPQRFHSIQRMHEVHNPAQDHNEPRIFDVTSREIGVLLHMQSGTHPLECMSAKTVQLLSSCADAGYAQGVGLCSQSL